MGKRLITEIRGHIRSVFPEKEVCTYVRGISDILFFPYAPFAEKGILQVNSGFVYRIYYGNEGKTVEVERDDQRKKFPLNKLL